MIRFAGVSLPSAAVKRACGAGNDSFPIVCEAFPLGNVVVYEMCMMRKDVCFLFPGSRRTFRRGKASCLGVRGSRRWGNGERRAACAALAGGEGGPAAGEGVGGGGGGLGGGGGE